MSHLRLLSTDFDGTLIGYPSDGKCSAAFAEALIEHRKHGGLWAINTGRSLDHIIAGLEIFAPPVMPDFLLIHEREIYRRVGEEWSSYGDWNDSCRLKHQDLYVLAGSVFDLIREMADASDNTITILHENDLPVGLVTSTEEVMEVVAKRVEELAMPLPDFGYQRNFIYMRFCHRDYHKGSALRELCRLEGIAAENVFAAGDHHNDISMLDGNHASMTACPANAIDAVKETVRRTNGYIANEPWADGIAEALRFYRAPRFGREEACA